MSRLPRIAVVSTGDELVDVEALTLAPGQIRRSNDRALEATLRGRGFREVRLARARDDLQATIDLLEGLLAEHEVLVLSGGVSAGQRDFVPKALQSLGVEVVLHRIAQQPGKPLWFGVGPGGQLVFALPGNPLSALVCCVRHVLPALEQAMGLQSAAPEQVVLGAAVERRSRLTRFVPVRVHQAEDTRQIATPVRAPTSGDFSALPASDGVVELPPADAPAPAGSIATLHRW